MIAASLIDVQNNLSRYVAEVQRGTTARISSPGEPVADLVPVRVGGSDDALDAHLAALERAGVVSRGTGLVPPEVFTPIQASGTPLSKLVSLDRDETA